MDGAPGERFGDAGPGAGAGGVGWRLGFTSLGERDGRAEEEQGREMCRYVMLALGRGGMGRDGMGLDWDWEKGLAHDAMR